MARDGRVRRLKLRGGVRYPVDEVLRIERGEVPTTTDGPASSPTPAAVSSASPERPSGQRSGRPARVREPAATYLVDVPGAAASPAPVDAAPTLTERRPSLPPVVVRTWYCVCIAHRKGGVAKSTTTWYLARELARAGKRVVLRDLDPQQGLRDILRDHGCEDGRYSRAIALVEDGEPLPFSPDVELIDTPPALDDSLPGVARSDAVIVPAMPEHQAVRALERMLLVLDQTRHEHPFTRVLGILPVRVKSRWAEHAAFLRQIEILGERFGHPVLPAVPESRAVLTYSLRGRLWRPVAEIILADLERNQRGRAGDWADTSSARATAGTGA